MMSPRQFVKAVKIDRRYKKEDRKWLESRPTPEETQAIIELALSIRKEDDERRNRTLVNGNRKA